ncbi:MAG TPA: TIGR01777 family protein [Chitinophagaceae bacterium]|nr:TIGR01777 family protein [Chitinophagaceae bacterium]
MAHYIIAGGSGFVGQHLQKLLQGRGHQVSILSTRKQIKKSNHIYWDPTVAYIDPDFRCQQGILINLAGAGVADKRWTAKRKEEIRLSRIQSNETLYQAIRGGQLNVQYFVGASAIGFYEADKNHHFETDPGDQSFLSQVCQQWEQSSLRLAQLNIPVSIARIGIVMGQEGGALPALTKSFSFGIAGIPSGGHQIYSWIHVEDLCHLLLFLADYRKEGIYNAVAPTPVSLKVLIQSAIRASGKKVLSIPVPAFLLKLALGEMSIEVLKSSSVRADKILEAGFRFEFPEIQTCMNDLFAAKKVVKA